MTSDQLRDLYLDFFSRRGHARIRGASLFPENDSTVLFTTAGMHPLVPFLMGEKHPAGRRLVDSQKCIRTGDIECVGDLTHLTFFEMLGNWSLGDYFKREAITWSWEFLTGREWLGFDPSRLSVTVFAGDEAIPQDEEAAAIWEELGIPLERIHFLGRADNWWGPAGATGPCGPDTEMFIDTGCPSCGTGCRPGCPCGKYFEIWNDVFMQYNKTREGGYVPLAQRNVDTGMGIERTVAMINGAGSVFDIPVYQPLVQNLLQKAGHSGPAEPEFLRSLRITADHVRTSTHILGDDLGVPPSNLDSGYVLRRLIRLAIRHAKKIGIEGSFLEDAARTVIDTECSVHPELARNRAFVLEELSREEGQFAKTLQGGMREFERLLPNLLKNPARSIPGRVAFTLYDTYGFPVEFTAELAAESGMTVDMDGYKAAFEKHRDLSRAGMDRKFGGGLADHSDMVTRLHTATHLLHKALREVLGTHVVQKGSNITAERLRFDFSHPCGMSEEQVAEVERLVNGAIGANLAVICTEMSVEEAGALGAIGLFQERYGERVKVYRIGEFSIEICGGPHVESTGELGRFSIQSEKSSSAGIRRIKAVLE
jgi:alanyl-tRNA synthetase